MRSLPLLLGGLLLGGSLLAPGATSAQEDTSPGPRDEEARRVFEAGSLAFDDARYEDALGYFRRAPTS